MATERPKFTVIVDDDILQFIEKYRYEHKLRSKSAAAVELLQLAIEVTTGSQKTPKVNQ